jgi:hypothetical protein
MVGYFGDHYRLPVPAVEVPHRSIITWPDSVYVGNAANESVDTHQSKGHALAVCRGVTRAGMGGDGKVYPLSTRVEKIEDSA